MSPAPSGAEPRRRALLALGLGLVASPALAQTPPDPAAKSRPARSLVLLVGGPGGGAGDRWARGFAPYLERQLPRAALGVEAVPGEGGLTAIRRLLEASDARLMGTVSAPLLFSRAIELGETPLLHGLDWLAAVSEEPIVLVTADRPGTDLAGFRALGEAATLGLPPPGTAAALFGHAWMGLSPANLLHFPSAAAARQAALAGNVAAAAVTLPEAIGAIRDGRLVPLGLASASRCALLPEVPTLAEQGFPLIASAQRGFVLPPGVPPRIRERLVAALRATVEDPEFRARGDSAGFIPRFLAPEAWSAQVADSLSRLGRRWSEEPWQINTRG